MLRYMASLVLEGHQELLALHPGGGGTGAASSALPPISSGGARKQLPLSLRCGRVHVLITRVLKRDTGIAWAMTNVWSPSITMTTHRWVRLECSLYAANVVIGRWAAEIWPQKRPGGGVGGAKGVGAAAAVGKAAHPRTNIDDGDDDENEGDEAEDSDEDMESTSAAGGGQGVGKGSHRGGDGGSAGKAAGGAFKVTPEADAAVRQLVEVAAASVTDVNGEIGLV